MIRAAHAIVVALVVLTASCASEHADEPEVTKALDATVAALQARDWDALWELTDPASQEELIALLRGIHEALKKAPEVYADAGATRLAAARTALGEALVDTIFPDEERAGPRLIERLFAADALRFDGHAMDGVTHHDITLDETHEPVKALVHTAAGETFAFLKTDAGWRSLLVRDLILSSSAFRTLADNVKKIDAELEARREAWRHGRDPRTPQGAYNVARAALGERPANAKLLYSLLDGKARAEVVEALKESRTAQREVQRRTTRKQRRKAYEDAGLTLYVDAKSDVELYSRWARTEGWKPPLAVTDDPERVEGDPASGRVEVVTLSGGRVAMTVADDGTWRIADQAAVLAPALRTPFASQPETP
ncbi:MAG: hypothetical protein EP329_20525 [Deltaproteobacteria bacterium]|nr:MAG: hypothetical protein EP329_20525 [Deltaproteobacteria bacterium]